MNKVKEKKPPELVGDEFPPLLTTEQVAEILQSSVDVVLRLIDRGELGRTRGGRRYLVPRAELNRHLQAGWQEPTA